jgi:hypothetical protein
MTTDTFSVYRNVLEEYSIHIPDDYVEEPINAFVRFKQSVSMEATADLTIKPSVAFTVDAIEMASTPATEVQGGTSTFDVYSTDCIIVQGRTDSFGSTGDGLWLGTETTGGVVIGNYKAWLPFVVTLNKGVTVLSATLKLTASYTNSNIVSLKFGCEKVADPVAPTNYNDLNARVMTAAFTNVDNVESWTTGTVYSYDVTSAVQEVLNLTDWVNGDVLAVITGHGALPSTGFRRAAMYEDTVYGAAQLVVVT